MSGRIEKGRKGIGVGREARGKGTGGMIMGGMRGGVAEVTIDIVAEGIAVEGEIDMMIETGEGEMTVIGGAEHHYHWKRTMKFIVGFRFMKATREGSACTHI